MEVMGAFGMALFKPRDSRLRQRPLQSGIYLNSYKSPVAIWLLTGIVTLSLGKSGVKKKKKIKKRKLEPVLDGCHSPNVRHCVQV